MRIKELEEQISKLEQQLFKERMKSFKEKYEKIEKEVADETGINIKVISLSLNERDCEEFNISYLDINGEILIKDKETASLYFKSYYYGYAFDKKIEVEKGDYILEGNSDLINKIEFGKIDKIAEIIDKIYTSTRKEMNNV